MIRRGRRASPEATGGPTVLVDHWYSHAVGHVIEALRRCQGYHVCDPTLRVSLVLNGASPIELVRCAPFVQQVFSVPYTSFGTVEGSPKAALREVPRDWDFVLRHPAASAPEEMRFDGLRRYYDASRRHFRARIADGVAGREPPAYAPHQVLRLMLPEDARACAERPRRPPVYRGDAGRELLAEGPVPLRLLLAPDPRRARAAVPGHRVRVRRPPPR